MKVTLNKLNKIRNALSVSLKYPESMYSFRTDQDLPVMYEKMIEKYKEEKINYIVGVFVLGKIRSLISKANHDNKIDILINSISCQETILKSMKPPEQYRSSGESIEDVIAQKTHLQALVDSGQPPQAPKRHNVSLLKTLGDDLNKEIKTIINQIEALKEERNALNHKVLVELPEDVVDFLKKIELV